MINRDDFGTDGLRNKVGKHPITDEVFYNIGLAIGDILLEQQHQAQVCVADDGRWSAATLKQALFAGLSKKNIKFFDFGLCPTPALALLTTLRSADMGLMITASHNPASYNGLKCFHHNGEKWQANDIDKLVERITNQTYNPTSEHNSEPQGHWVEENYLQKTQKMLGHKPHLPKKIHVVMDCGHGATSKLGPLLWRALGFDVQVIHAQPDGQNINDNAGSTQPDTLQRQVVASGADLGVAFDGDGDRVILIDEEGHILDGDDIVYILAHGLPNKDQAGVVTTMMSNTALTDALEALGLSHERVAVGDKHVRTALKHKGWRLGGEPSGHIILHPYCLSGDGILAGLLCVLEAFRHEPKLSRWRKKMVKYPRKLVNVPINISQQKQQALESYLSDLQNKYTHKVSMMVRRSGTEPVLRVSLESKRQIDIDDLTNQISSYLSTLALAK